jgi:hypothetical protein
MRDVLATVVGAIVLSGCASSLEIKDQSKTLVPGVPFRTAQVYIKSGLYEKHTKGLACDPSSFVEEVSLPTGALYYANVKPAQFAKTGFALKVNDKGGLSEITLNTEPSAVEAAKNVADLVGAVLPVLGVAPAGVAGGTNVACDTGPRPSSIAYKPLEASIIR